MSKTPEGRSLDPSPVNFVENVSGDDRLIRIIQALLAVYLLPALVLVLLVGFAMLFVGAIPRVILRIAQLLSPARGFAKQPDSRVSGAWVYRAGGGGSWARHREPQTQAMAQGGWIQRPDSDVLN